MRKTIPLVAGLVIGSVVFAAILLATSAQAQAPSTVPITTIVTVLGPKFTEPPTIAKEDVVVFSGKTRLPVVAWTSAQGQRGGLQLAILIDNAVSSSGFGVQLKDVTDFIAQQPKTTAIGVFYARNGTVQIASSFNRDHDAVAKALRVPVGAAAGDSPSIYVSLGDLIHRHWTPTGARREVLLISSGVDRLDRGPDSPYVRAAIEDAQKAGVEVHAIYTDGLGFSDTLRGQFAQANLAALADGSGGYNLFEGVSTPSSFAPYLKQLGMALGHQYRLTFSIELSHKAKGELREISVRTEEHGVDLKYPKQVLVPGPAK